MKIALVCPRGNPVATAWWLALDSIGHDGLVHCETRGPSAGPHSELDHGVPEVRRVKFRDWPAAESVLDGTPDIVFLWWGCRSLLWGATCLTRWPRSRLVVSLDTVPCASWWGGEVREWLHLAQHKVHGLVFASSQMRRDLLLRCPWLHTVPGAVVPVVFPASAFARSQRELPEKLVLEASSQPRICFTGRTDFLFTSERRMRKDAIGRTLLDLVHSGAAVWLSGLQKQACSHGARPFNFMPRFSNADLFNGRMATYLAQFNGTLLLYNVHDRTIRRRVRNSLSTRLALAVTTPTAWIINGESRVLCEELWGDEPWGLVLDEAKPQRTLQELRSIEGLAQSRWEQARGRLTMEHYHAVLRDLLSKAASL